MNVTVLLFAKPRELVGAGRLDLDVDEGATPDALFADLCAEHPDLGSTRDHLRVAVDQGYAAWDTPLHAGAEVAFIPPTAGG